MFGILESCVGFMDQCVNIGGRLAEHDIVHVVSQGEPDGVAGALDVADEGEVRLGRNPDAYAWIM